MKWFFQSPQTPAGEGKAGGAEAHPERRPRPKAPAASLPPPGLCQKHSPSPLPHISILLMADTLSLATSRLARPLGTILAPPRPAPFAVLTPPADLSPSPTKLVNLYPEHPPPHLASCPGLVSPPLPPVLPLSGWNRASSLQCAHRGARCLQYCSDTRSQHFPCASGQHGSR